MNLAGFASARVDLGFLDRARVALHNPDLRPAWRQARKPIRADLREHAKKQAAPGGSWPGLSDASKVRAAQGRKRPRNLLGRLPGALRTTAERRRFLVTWRTKWAEAQRSGDTVGHGARVPGRDWAWVSDRATEVVANIIAKGLAYLIEVA